MKKTYLNNSIFTVIFFIICASQVHSQEKYNTGFARGTGGINFYFPKESPYIGANFGIMNTNNNLRAKLLFALTPAEKKTYIKQSSNFYRRYLERRYIFGPVLDKHFSISNDFGLSLEAGYIHSFGSRYAGTDIKSEKKWVPILGGGVDIIISESVILRISYKYMPLPSTDNQGIGFSLII